MSSEQLPKKMTTEVPKKIFPKKKSSVLSILPKVRAILGTADVEGTVKKAITDNCPDSLGLLKSIRVNVSKNTILDNIIKQCEEIGDEAAKLNKPMLSFFNDYFRMLGADSALSQIIAVCNKINEVGKGVHNLSVLLSHILETVNVLGSEKLRTGIFDTVAPVILKLWEAGKKEEACILTRELLYIVVSERDYLGKSSEHCVEKWTNAGFMDKSLLSSPFMCTLALLLSECHDITGAINRESFVKICEQNDGEGRQLSILLGAHLATLSQYQIFDDVVHFLVNFHSKEGTLNELSAVLADCSALCLNSESTLSHAVLTAVCALLVPNIQSKDPVVMKLVENVNSDGKPKVKKAKKDVTEKFDDTNVASLVAQLQVLDDLSREDMAIVANILVAVLSAFSLNSQVVDSTLSTLNTLFSKYSGDISLPTDIATVLTRTNVLKMEVQRNPLLLSETIFCVVCSSAPLFSAFAHAVKNVPSAGWGDSERATVAAVFCRAATHKGITPKMIDWSFVSVHVDRLSKKLVGSQSASLLSALTEWGKEQRESIIASDLIDSKRRAKIVEISYSTLSSAEITDISSKRAAIAFFASNASAFVSGEKAYVERLLDWQILSSLCSLDPKLIEPIANKARPEAIADLLEAFPEEEATLSTSLCVVHSVLSVRLQVLSARLCAPLSTILAHSLVWKNAVGLAAQVLAAVGAPKASVGSLVSLALAIGVEKSQLNLESPDATILADSLQQMEFLLLNVLKYTPTALLSDQCAVYAELFGIHLRHVAAFCTAFPTESEFTHRLMYGCERIVAGIAKHSSYFEKVVPAVVSSCVLSWENVPLPAVRLCSVMERPLSACLATNLPAAEKRAFARLMENVKKANKKIV